MSSTINLKASGLLISPNQLEVQPGALTEASNVIIKRSSVIEPRRGFTLYGSALPSIADRTFQLFTYKNRLLRQYFDNNTSTWLMQYDSDGNGAFLTFSGAHIPADTNIRTKSIQANGNLYFTSQSGIQKISAKTNNDFTTNSGYITPAGGIKAINITSSLSITQGLLTGFLSQDSTVAYRAVWGYNDANGNLVLGTPSQRTQIYNSLLSLDLLDYNTVLGALDNISSNSLINNANYSSTFYLASSASANQLYISLANLCVTIDNNLLYANTTSGAPLTISTGTSVTISSSGLCTITFSSGNPQNYWSSGNRINLSGFTPTSGTLNGPQQITLVTASTIQFNTTLTAQTFSATGGLINGYEYTARKPTASVIPLQVGSPYPLPSSPPTNNDLVNLQKTILSIIQRLQIEPNATINSSVASKYIAPLSITTSVNVNITIAIPQGVTTNDFLQLYRSPTLQATGTTILSNLTATDELQLAYEGFPTAAQISSGFITINDITPDSFLGAFLYSNQVSGQGALQTNDLPPFAKDINFFKNVTFYANTSTRQRLSISLLGVQNMLSSYNASNPPTLTITNGTITNTYHFIVGINQITSITCNAGSTLASFGTASYFTMYNANNQTNYLFWYNIGTATAPVLAGYTYVPILALSSDTNIQIAYKTNNAINRLIFDFTSIVSSNIITVTNTNQGYTNNPSNGTSGFSISVTTSGQGENVSLKQILLSNVISPSQAVDQTSRSLINVINENINESVYLYYTSSSSGVPGEFLIEARNINNSQFYLATDSLVTGSSFSPNLSPNLQISNITAASSAVITTTTPHLLLNNAQVILSNTNSTPIVDGLYTITYISPTSFSVPITTTISGNKGSVSVAVAANFSSNQTLPNRIYYSKISQPDAVPIVNTIDVGAIDKAILRIFPLRDSLFVYKEDGLFRISGEIAPFNLALFDASVILLASDSLSLCNNLIYGWTTQGITVTSEAGASIVSRPIDINILKLASSNYSNFKNLTWGIGYDSDNSYTVYTNQNTTDTYATIGLRYCNLTNTWTSTTKTDVCGIINPYDDKMYMGAGDTNYIEQERKTFTRLDYVDREVNSTLSLGNYYGNQIFLSNLVGINVGDSFAQIQNLTVYTFNSLLQKLDLDSNIGISQITNITTGINPTITTSVAHNLIAGNYVTIKNSNCVPSIDGLYQVISSPTTTTFTIITKMITLAGNLGQAKFNYNNSLLAKSGDNLRTDIVTLAHTLDGDPATINKNYYTLIQPISGTISANTISNPTVITSTAHGLVNGRKIQFTSSNSNPLINGIYTITLIDSNHFSIPVNVNLTAGTAGSYITQNDDFQDVVSCYNAIINNLNIDNGLSFKNYLISTNTTTLESTITNINNTTKIITLDKTLNFIVGPVTIYNAIPCEFTYSPNTMGDAMSLKHFSESTIMFENKAFTSATLSFATDLHPSFIDVKFNGDGNGIFGTPKFGQGYFGGNSNSVPFRTYVPASCQRCRYIVLKFNHTIAREKFSIFGISLTGNMTSSRAYR